MIKVLFIFGTRPEVIKMAPVIKEVARYSQQVTGRVCVTGQHREMLDAGLTLFDIQPNYDLNVMRPDQSLTRTAATILQELEGVLSQEKPDWVLVQGDTTTAMMGALAGFYAGAKVGHIEAGLRTYDRSNPFPEEAHRAIISKIATYHFAPTEHARQNLIREGIDPLSVVTTGNTIVDALVQIAQIECDCDLLRTLSPDERIVLVTVHRRESFGPPLRAICAAVRQLVARNDHLRIVLPLHPNPNVRQTVIAELGTAPRVSLIEPLDYLLFVHLMRRATLILTDSGGIQEEAPTFGIPVLVLRTVTERIEALQAGTAQLVGADTQTIVDAAQRLLDSSVEYEKMVPTANPFGDGNASSRIVRSLLNHSDSRCNCEGDV